jgi:aromatic-amino-acid transaminase
MFQHIEGYPGDPVLTLNEDFHRDQRGAKVNLGIGVYTDGSGVLPVMSAVARAEATLLARSPARPYLPMEGAPAYRRLIQQLLFGAGHEAVTGGRIATVQTLGGSGALRLGADFLQQFFGQARVWVSDPSWDNHRAIFAGSGCGIGSYRYYRREQRDVDFAAMLAACETMQEGDVMLLHACCHNPTGADLSHEQWRQLAAALRKRKLVPFFDIAYQGFGAGLEDDSYALRHFAEQGMTFFVASSCSKNFSLYGERVGSLSVVCPDARQADTVLGQLKAAVRRSYSSPPGHGAALVAAVLGSAPLRAEWAAELEAMRLRIAAMRAGLCTLLAAQAPGHDFDYLLGQRGMFGYTGLSLSQVAALRDAHGVYLVGSGRLCMAALTPANLEYVAAALAEVLQRGGAGGRPC